MRTHDAIALSLFLLITAYTPGVPLPTPVATATLVACTNFARSAATQPSIFPTFTPTSACQLEQTYQQVNYCMVQASPERSYSCLRTEAIEETLLGQSASNQLIQCDYHFNAGCWQASAMAYTAGFFPLAGFTHPFILHAIPWGRLRIFYF